MKTQCIKVSSLRKTYGSDIDLKKWIEMPENLYVGRNGRIFITDKETKDKNIFHYKGSKWANPFKVGDKDYKLEESLKLYKEHVVNTGLINDIDELGGKVLGCFCDQNNGCHAKILMELYKAKQILYELKRNPDWEKIPKDMFNYILLKTVN